MRVLVEDHLFHRVSTHAPLAGSDAVQAALDELQKVSTHAPLAGSDGAFGVERYTGVRFNPRSPCGERRYNPLKARRMAVVSTHAPLAGSDVGKWSRRHPERCFNPRSPCGERPMTASRITRSAMSFNPRSPCGERPMRGFQSWWTMCFNPRSPCGERQFRRAGRQSYRSFNPRSPCGERPVTSNVREVMFLFQPTLPLRGATGYPAWQARTLSRFNPRSPCGERRLLPFRPLQCARVSTHAPLAGSDVSSLLISVTSTRFQPTLPLRGATLACAIL